MITVFKIISTLEGISYILLLFIGTPLKYFTGNDVVVKTVGMPHGILFLLYIVAAFLVWRIKKWNMKIFLIVLAASLVPFGTFYVNKKYV